MVDDKVLVKVKKLFEVLVSAKEFVPNCMRLLNFFDEVCDLKV